MTYLADGLDSVGRELDALVQPQLREAVTPVPETPNRAVRHLPIEGVV